MDVDGIVATIPKGKLATSKTLCEALARMHGTTLACPVTTGILFGIVARAAAEMEEMGAKRVTPWWRVIRPDGTLNAKMPGGLAEHARRLEAEGHIVRSQGRDALGVDGFEKRLAKLR